MPGVIFPNKFKAFTVLELILAVTLLSILSTILYLKFKPLENKNKAKDLMRIAHIQEVDRVVNEYFMDFGRYPGDVNVTYSSLTNNWIPIDNLNNYISRLPVDPYGKIYYYKHDAYSYEIATSLDYLTEMMQTDNGNSPTMYEIGNNLLLINN